MKFISFETIKVECKLLASLLDGLEKNAKGRNPNIFLKGAERLSDIKMIRKNLVHLFQMADSANFEPAHLNILDVCRSNVMKLMLNRDVVIPVLGKH